MTLNVAGVAISETVVAHGRLCAVSDPSGLVEAPRPAYTSFTGEQDTRVFGSRLFDGSVAGDRARGG